MSHAKVSYVVKFKVLCLVANNEVAESQIILMILYVQLLEALDYLAS